MRFELDEHHRYVTDEELLADLKRVASLRGSASVTMEQQNADGRFHASTFHRRFGNWFEALRRAGLQQSRTPPYIPEEELFKNLEEVWTKLGRQPRYSDLKGEISVYGNKTYANRFGSWRRALEAFVAFINSTADSSLDESIQQVDGTVGSKRGSSRYINWRLRFVVMRRDNFKCKACGRSPATDPTITLDVDHIKAWSKGGLTVLENLQTLCTQCNTGKSDLEFANDSVSEVQNDES